MSSPISPIPLNTSRIAAIKQVQRFLHQQGLNAFWLPHNDVHQNEYLPDVAKLRDALLGFTGSAGDALILLDTVWLFVDGRYYVQAEQEVPLSHVKVSKLGLEGQPTLLETLAMLPPGSRVGFDPRTVSSHHYNEASRHLSNKGIQWVPLERNPVTSVLQAFPELTSHPTHANQHVRPWQPVDARVHGYSTPDKLTWLRQSLTHAGCQGIVLSAADEIAWLLNTRGGDIPYNPVFLSFLWVDETQAILFASPPEDSSTTEILHTLKAEGVTLQPYESVWDVLTSLAQQKTVYWVAAAHSTKMEMILREASATCIPGPNVIQQKKAIKTPEEQAGMREANLRSSCAVIRTLAWLDAQAQGEHPVSEVDIADFVQQAYRDEGAIDLSFNTIAGFGDHAAIIHYGTPSATRTAQRGDWVLLDSGAQYPFGTTDITRTTTFGNFVPEEEHRRAYTYVLKSHIAGASAVFPKGSSGAQLDGVVRAPLWQAGYDFSHGTGHGVGCFLNVHEGPYGISKGYNVALPVSTVVSIEPGYYVPGWGGIRLENLALIQPAPDLELAAGTPQREWYRFELLNLIPFAKHLVDTALLNKQEQAWLCEYERAIMQTVLPQLQTRDAEAAAWLKQAFICFDPSSSV
jgi:Xaa-Pro aminopeptidase